MIKIDKPLKLTFLGTGTSQGIPVIGSNHPVCLSKNPKDKRLRVSVLISWDNYNYVIDCGPDFQATNVDGKMLINLMGFFLRTNILTIQQA